MNNFVAVGNDELGGDVKKGDIVIKGDMKGVVEYGKDGTTDKESSVLGFVTVEDGASYLVAIQNKLVFGTTRFSVRA